MNKKPKIIDLSLTIEEGIISYPTSVHQRFESSILGRLAIEGRETRKFTMGSHCATHIDAMRHFLPGGKSVDDFSMDQLIGNAYLVDLGILNPKHIIESEDLDKYLKNCENLQRLIIRTNWSRFWNTKQYYTDWPYCSKAAIEYLIKKGIQLLGIDFPSPDPAYFGKDCSLDCPNHKLLFKKEIILVEYLTNLEKLNPGPIFLMVMPLKLKGFDGAPARVAAYSL